MESQEITGVLLFTAILAGCNSTTDSKWVAEVAPRIEPDATNALTERPLSGVELVFTPSNNKYGIFNSNLTTRDGKITVTQRTAVNTSEVQDSALFSAALGEGKVSNTSFTNKFNVNAYSYFVNSNGSKAIRILGVYGKPISSKDAVSLGQVTLSGAAEGFVRASDGPRGNFSGTFTGEIDFDANSYGLSVSNISERLNSSESPAIPSHIEVTGALENYGKITEGFFSVRKQGSTNSKEFPGEVSAYIYGDADNEDKNIALSMGGFMRIDTKPSEVLVAFAGNDK